LISSFVPVALPKPDVELVVLLSQRYAYVPLPPLGVVPVKPLGVVPVQIACAVLTVLFAITGLTVISIAVDTSLQPPDVTVLRYQVVVVKAPGA
jgi:hypothetical protein